MKRQCSAAAMLSVLLAWPVAAETPVPAPVSVRMRVGIHAGYERIAFDWSQQVPYTVERNGGIVTVRFGKAARYADAALRSGKLRRLQVGGAPSPDGVTYHFAVAPQAVIKDFRKGNSVVIDVGGALPNGALTAPAAAETVVVAEPAAPVALPARSTTTSALHSNKVRPAVVTSYAALPPIALAPIRHLDKASLYRTVATSLSAAPASAPSPRDQSVPIERAVLAMAETTSAISTLQLPAPGRPPMLLLQLSTDTPMGLAAYVRGGYAYLILERRLADPQQAIIAPLPQLQLQPLHLASATGWRFPVPSGADLRTDRSGSLWSLYLAGERRQIPITLSLLAEPNYALGARIFLPLVNPPEIVRYIDPVIGDALSVVPLQKPGDALTIPRRYADFTAIASAQGLVVAHHTDELMVRKVPNGVEISAPEGLRLSPPQDTGMAPRAKIGKRQQGLMFDFSAWHGLPGEDFTDTRQRLWQNIVDVPAAERDRARIELARFYFAHGLAAEALALLNYMEERLPDLFARPEYRALHGAAQILANNPAAGMKDFAIPDLQEVVDRPLWEALALAQLRDYAAAAPKFEATIGLLDDLPPVLFKRFALMALESLVATNQAAKAGQWLEDWRRNPEREEFVNSAGAEYLTGVIYYAQASMESAAKHWRRAAASDDRLYRTRAELALVDFDVSRKKLTAAAAAQRLEGLRFAWRGDPLEWEILRRLGLYYIQAQKYRDGFVNLERARRLYPDLPGNPDLAQKLSDVFHDIFTGALGTHLTPLEALSLYQDYRYLVTDPTVARPIMRSLTERLVAIDLLEQAAQLLQDLLLAASGEERGRIGARLAGIRLLDHKPEKAIAALDESQIEGAPPDLTQERLLLRARALVEQGKTDDAKALLSGQNDAEGQQLLADLAWRNGQWGEAAVALRRALGAPPAEGALDADKAQTAVRTATAYALAGDQVGLKVLATEFSAAMKPTAQNALFAVLIEAQDGSSLRDMANKLIQNNDSDRYQKFLERYRAPQGETEPPAKAPVR